MQELLPIPTYWQVSSNNDSIVLFENETEYLVNALLKEIGVGKANALRSVYEDYEEMDVEHSIASLLIYQSTLIEASRVSPRDVFNEHMYIGLMSTPGVAILRQLCIKRFFHRLNRNMDFLGLSKFFSKDPDSLLNSVASEGDQEYSIIKVSEEESEDALPLILHALDKLGRPKPAKRRTKPPLKITSVRRVKKNKTFLDLSQKIKGTCPPFSAFWMMPPPISPADISEMVMHEHEAAFIIDSFGDVYTTEGLLLSLYFLIKRNSELWLSESRVLGTPYMIKELEFNSNVVHNVTNVLFSQVTTKFLGIEGISLISERLSGIFETSRDVREDLGAVFAEILHVVREAALYTGRLRASLLYGRKHVSYVSDEFLSSFLDYYCIATQSAIARDNLELVVDNISSLILPNDEIKLYKTLVKYDDNTSKGRRALFEEPKTSRQYEDLTTRMASDIGTQTRGSLGGEEPIPSNGKKGISKYLSIYEDYWESSVLNEKDNSH